MPFFMLHMSALKTLPDPVICLKELGSSDHYSKRGGSPSVFHCYTSFVVDTWVKEMH